MHLQCFNFTLLGLNKKFTYVNISFFLSSTYIMAVQQPNFGIGGLAETNEDYTSHPYDLKAPITVEEDVISSGYSTFYPATDATNSDDKQIVFVLPPESFEWTLLPTIRMHGELRVVNTATNKAPVVGEVFNVVNYYPQSLFSNVSCQIQNHVIKDPTSIPYPYKAYLETLCSTSAWYQDTHLAIDGWCKDLCQMTDATDAGTTPITSNHNYFHADFRDKRLHGGLQNGDWKEFAIPIHNDVINIHRRLSPHHRMIFRFERNKPDWSFIIPSDSMTTATDTVPAKPNRYKFELKNLRLKIKRSVTNENITKDMYAIGDGKRRSSINRLPFTRNIFRTYDKYKDSIDLSYRNFIESKQLPEQIILFFVEMEAYQGDPGKNPYNFEYVPLREASLYINNKHEPMDKLCSVAAEGKKRELYELFLDNLGRNPWASQAVNITYDEFYNKGLHMYVWDRTKSMTNRSIREKNIEGNISVMLVAEEKIKKNYTICMYCSYSDLLESDQTDGFNVTTLYKG